MKDVTRYIPKDIRDELYSRSGGICECCRVDVQPDRHHIYKFSKSRNHSLENLIYLCPNCHRQVPNILNHEQQQLLQSWHNTQVTILNSSQPENLLNKFIIGSNTCINCKNILVINNTPIISVYKGIKGFYLNFICLENIIPKMLILGDRVILNASDTKIQRSENETKIFWNENVILEVERLSEKEYAVNFKLILLDKTGLPYAFDANATATKFFGGTFKNNVFDCNGGSVFAL